MDAEQILAFRLARSGLVARVDALEDGLACPASDFARDAALLALGARVASLSRETYDAAVDAGDVVVAHVVRGAIHAVRAQDFALYGRALVARDDDELATQMGQQVKRLASEKGFAPGAALDEVAAAVGDALASSGPLDKNALHEQLRRRVRAELMPWCKGCKSHHVAPMLWRYATVKAGVRLDSQRRYVIGSPGRAPAAAEAVRRFLGFYGPATPGTFGDWAGLARPHAERLWSDVAGEMEEVRVGRTQAWILVRDRASLESPPTATGIRLLPPGDPYLQLPNRPLLAPDAALRKRLFRPVASPGAVLKDGRLAGLWRAKSRKGKLEVEIEKLTRIGRPELADEANRVAALRGASGAVLAVD